MSAVAAPAPAAPVAGAEARLARRETLQQLLRSKTFIAGAVIVGWSGVLGDRRLAPRRRTTRLEQRPSSFARRSATTGWARTLSAATCSRACSPGPRA